MTAPLRNQILHGDALQRLRDLPDSFADGVITSPPYFRLRDYGVEGQLGLENHVNQWVVELLAVTRELQRVLVPTGTLWINLGDSYSTHDREGAPPKSLLAAPERLLLGLIEQGWRVRNKIVWAKTNPMPTSTTDRLATTHEVIYVLARQRKYFFDLDAIRVPHTSKRGSPLRATVGVNPPGGSPPPKGKLGTASYLGPNADTDTGLRSMKARGLVGHPLGKNPGDVWRIPSSSFRGAHFATYPEALVERMVKAGIPEQRCTACRQPWTRPVRRLGATAVRLALRATCPCEAASEPGLVLDPFLGSGTTAVVAEREHRDWLGIELSAEFVHLAEKRIQSARGAVARDAGSPSTQRAPNSDRDAEPAPKPDPDPDQEPDNKDTSMSKRKNNNPLPNKGGDT